MNKHTLLLRQTVLLGLLGSVLFAGKMAFAALPNIEPVSLLVMVYASVLRSKALYTIAVYVVLEYAFWGIHLWSVNYLYVWFILYAAARLLRRMQSPVGWAVLSGAFGLCFGLLCAPVYLFSGGAAFALSWWLAGIPWDIAHCAGNFVFALFLFVPLRKVLEKLCKNYFSA